MGAVGPRGLAVTTESQPHLVHERGRLKRLVSGFTRHLCGRELAQLVIDERKELVSRGRVAVLDALKHQRDVAV
jgi:hypothetical protein